LIGEEIAKKSPDTIILVTPHGVMFQDAIAISYENEIYGDLKNFRVPSVKIELEINKELTTKIYEIAYEEGNIDQEEEYTIQRFQVIRHKES
jgi:aromatic ring-opening dioxygenase LigB subunit